MSNPNQVMQKHGHNRDNRDRKKSQASMNTSRINHYEYDDFMDEIFGSNPRRQKLVDDAERFLKDLREETDKNSDNYRKHEKEDRDAKHHFQDYLDNLELQIKNGKYNIQEFEDNVRHGKITEHHQFHDLDIHEIIDIPKNNVAHNEHSKWFDHLRKSELKRLRNVIEDLGAKMFRSRMTEEMKETRNEIADQIHELVHDLRHKNPMEHKEKLLKLEKHVLELQQYDQVIPSILNDLMGKVQEFVQQLLILSNEFSLKCDQALKNVEKYSFQNSKQFAYEFKNLDSMDSKKLRVARYGINLTNGDLATLHFGRPVRETIPYFFIEYFKERNHAQNLQSIQEIYVLPSKFFESLVPPGGILDWQNMRYRDVKALTQEYSGIDNTIFDRFPRVMIGILLSGTNFVIAEIKCKPEREILIYDSNITLSGRYHDRIVRCLRAYIIEEMRDKTNKTEGECIEFSRSFVGRGVAVPQVGDSLSNSIYFIKNLEFLTGGQYITPHTYDQKDMADYRVEIFSALIRVGINEDRPVIFDSIA